MINFIKSNKLLVAVLTLALVVLVSYIVLQTRTPSSPTPTPGVISSPRGSASPTGSGTPYETLPEDEKARLQTEADQKFGNFYKQTFENYPWFNELPLQDDNFFVYFDLNNKKIFAIIYQDQFNRGDTVDTVKKTITDQLIKLGVDLNTIPIEWQIK